MDNYHLIMEEQCAYRHDFLTVGNPCTSDESSLFKVTLSDLGLEGREVKIVARDDPLIERFLNDIPNLCALQATCGLVWDERLHPCNGRYEPNMHYFPTGQQTKKSAHGLIEFYRDGRSGTIFAVKILQEKDSFHREEICSRLQFQHKNIADVYGILIRSGMIHILMEHAGTPLVKERNWFAESPDRMYQLAKQCFQALWFLHVKGYVHCDVKPDNLMVVREGNTFTLKVIDFGTCRCIKQPLPPHAHTTWQYWPPEMWKALEKKEVFFAESSMDVYAMALTLYFVQMGSHLMLNMPQEVMSKRPEYVKMMALPESIPVDLRFVMDHCLEVNEVSRYTAEEAASRLEDSEPSSSLSSSSRREEYFANLNSVARSDGKKKSFVDNWLEKSGAKTDTLHCLVGSNKGTSQREIMVGPEAARFKRKTSIIFQKLERISNSNRVVDKRELRARPAGEFRFDGTDDPKSLSNCQTVVKKNCETFQKTDFQDSYPFLYLLENLVNEHNKNPISFPKEDMSDHCPVQKQAKVTSALPTQELTQTNSKVGKAKTSSGIARQKSRAKVRQKNYDRNQCTSKTSARKSISSEKTFGKVEKLWPSSAAGESSFDKADYKFTDNTKVDDMEFVFDALGPEAFKVANETNITDYMYEMLQRHEGEEGSERIRADMDGMSLSSPDVTDNSRNIISNEQMDQSGRSVISRVVTKEKPSSHNSVTQGLPNFELIS